MTRPSKKKVVEMMMMMMIREHTCEARERLLDDAPSGRKVRP
jgi:hypothetical protein